MNYHKQKLNQEQKQKQNQSTNSQKNQGKDLKTIKQ